MEIDGKRAYRVSFTKPDKVVRPQRMYTGLCSPAPFVDGTRALFDLRAAVAATLPYTAAFVLLSISVGFRSFRSAPRRRTAQLSIFLRYTET